MDMFWVHVGVGAIACIIIGLHSYRAGRDIGIEIGIKRGKDIIPDNLLKKFKQMDMRIQELKKGK